MLNFTSVIIPTRNEEKYIGNCLDSIVQQDYPKEKMEVLVVDAKSDDETRRIVREYCNKYSFIKLLDNFQGFTNSAFNIGLEASKGEVIIIMGAHADYKKDYVSKCVSYLGKHGADNVGGILKTLPANNSLAAKAISVVLSNFFGAASTFRIGSKKPKEVDTVFGGCYRKEVFEKVGFFNEKLKRSQDFEFNLRLRRAGGKILLFPDIVTYYYSSPDFNHFLRHNFSDGFWVTYPLKFGIKFFSLRHLIPLFFTFFLLSGLIFGIFVFWIRFIFLFSFAAYFTINFIVSFKISLKNGIKHLPVLMIAFFIRHFFYGLGSIWGLIRLSI